MSIKILDMSFLYEENSILQKYYIIIHFGNKSIENYRYRSEYGSFKK